MPSHEPIEELGRARALADELPAASSPINQGAQTVLGKAVERLERAVEAARRGERLVHGQCLEDCPVSVRESLTG